MNFRDLLHFLKKKNLKSDNPFEYQKNMIEYLNFDLHTAIMENVDWFSNNPKLYKNQAMYFEISISNITQKGMTLDDIIELNRRFNDITTGIFGLEYDNTSSLIFGDSAGFLYSFVVFKHQNDIYDLTIWDKTGSKHLLTLRTKNNILSKDEIKRIELVLEKYRNFIIECKGCGKDIKEYEIAGSHFAGNYCDKCWNDEYKNKSINLD